MEQKIFGVVNYFGLKNDFLREEVKYNGIIY